jgi:glutamine---fructose-6-phosphate transaminase (isomerizing)
MIAPAKICTKCLMPATYPGITFDKEGTCNFCQNYRKRDPWGEESLIEKLRSKSGGEYDCVLGISGGKDSCYVAYLAKEKFGLRALAVCYDFPFLVELARQNIKKVCDSLNLDILFVKSRNNLEYDFQRNHLISLSGTKTTWGQCIFCHYGIEGVLYNVAREKSIPFILSGMTENELWNPGSRTRFLLKRVKRMPFKDLLRFIYYQSKAYLNLVDQRKQFRIPGNNCFNVYSRAVLPGKGPEVIHVFDYVKWDQALIEQTLRERTGWQKPPRATSWGYDCILEPLLDYTYKREFGISTVGIYLSGLIRAGLIERPEAIRVQQISEGQEHLEGSLKTALAFLNVPEDIQYRYFI